MNLAQESEVILQMFDAFGADDRVEAAVGPGKRLVEVSFHKGVAQKLRRGEFDIRTNSAKASGAEFEAESSARTARRVENLRSRRKIQRWNSLQNGALDYCETLCHGATHRLSTSS